MQNKDKQQLIYLYDLPKTLVDSVKISKIIKDLTGYELQEPAHFRDCRQLHNGLAFDLTKCICKVDEASAAHVSKAMKYFNIVIGTDRSGLPINWECSALPFDRETLGIHQTNSNTPLNVYVKFNNNDKDITSKLLDRFFSESFGEVLSAKVSMTTRAFK